MLDSLSRAAIVMMSGLCIIVAVAFAPVRARGSSAFALPVRAQIDSLANTPAPDAVDVRRDPFSGEPPPSAAANAAPTAALPPTGIGPLPSNLPSSTIPAIPGTATADRGSIELTAIVTGAHPYALVASGGSHEIKGIGDRVHGTPIVAIDIHGITLSSGERLTVATGDSSR